MKDQNNVESMLTLKSKRIEKFEVSMLNSMSMIAFLEEDKKKLMNERVLI